MIGAIFGVWTSISRQGMGWYKPRTSGIGRRALSWYIAICFTDCKILVRNNLCIAGSLSYDRGWNNDTNQELLERAGQLRVGVLMLVLLTLKRHLLKLI